MISLKQPCEPFDIELPYGITVTVAYEQLKLLAQGDFNFDGLSLGSTRSIVGERKAELQDIARELKQLGDVGFMDDPLGWGRKVALERQLKEKTAIYQQWAAKLAWMQRDVGGKAMPKPNTDASNSTPDGNVEIDTQAFVMTDGVWIGIMMRLP